MRYAAEAILAIFRNIKNNILLIVRWFWFDWLKFGSIQCFCSRYMYYILYYTETNIVKYSNDSSWKRNGKINDHPVVYNVLFKFSIKRLMFHIKMANIFFIFCSLQKSDIWYWFLGIFLKISITCIWWMQWFYIENIFDSLSVKYSYKYMAREFFQILNIHLFFIAHQFQFITHRN